MKRVFHCSLITAALAASFSCTDFQEMDVPERLSVDVNEITLSPESANYSVKVQSGTSWDILGKPDWVSAKSITSLSQPYSWEVSFSVSQNDEYDRDGTIAFQSGNGLAHIALYQQGKKGQYVAIQRIEMNYRTLSLLLDETAVLNVVFYPSNASNQSVTWESDHEEIVSVLSTGFLSAKSIGTATITATAEDGGYKATCQVTVNPHRVTGVTLDKTSLTLTEGDTETLTATITPDYATDKSVTWSSSNPNVVSVSSDGKVTARSAGNATITVTTTDGGKKATCNVKVNPKVYPVTGVSLDQTSLSLVAGDTWALTATVTPDNATDKSVIWSSSNTSVATVSSSGVVTAKAGGTAKITVITNDGGFTATCNVTVSVPVSGVILDKTSLSMAVGDTQQLAASVLPANASDQSVAWSSSNTSVATVSSSGVVTAKAVGSATITVTTNDGGKTAACNVTVVIPVTGVSLDKTSLSMPVGDTRALTATITPSNATDKSVTWSSSNTTVATVSSTGVVTAKAGGSAIITVTTNEGGKTATCAVTVTVPVSGVSLNKTSMTLSEGDSQTLTATLSPSDATNQSVSWSSDNESVATVTSSGVVVAKTAGTAVITVTTDDGGKTASCVVTVKPRVTGVSLDNSSISLVVGSTRTLTATVTPSDALDKTVTWSSNNTSVATVSSSGTVSAKAVGTAEITVRTNDGGKTATCNVTVTPVSVTGVSLNKYSLTMYENDSETLIATVSPSNATNKTVTWSSSNYSVANVNSSGQVSAVAAGSVVITATTVDGGFTANCSVTVKADPYGAVDLGLSVKWASFNYGASSVTATGGYYMWGDPNGTAVPLYYTPPSVSSISGTQYDIVRKNWGGNWRIPTRAELNELYSKCSFTKTTVNGVSVLKVTGPSGSSIYLPFTGYGLPTDGNGSMSISDGNNAYVMSAESYADSYGRFAYVYYFTPSGGKGTPSYNAEFVKFPIRPVR